jgi:hypothetical protein
MRLPPQPCSTWKPDGTCRHKHVHCELRRHSRCRLGPCSTPGRAVVDKYAFTSEHSITMTRNVADGLEVHRPPPEGSHRSGAALRTPAAPTPGSRHRRPTTFSRRATVITRQMMSYLTIKGSALLTLSKLERVLLRAQGGWTEAMDNADAARAGRNLQRLNRSGVPQGRHVHALLGRGSQVLDELFPGLLDDLVADATPVLDCRRFVQGILLRRRPPTHAHRRFH